MRKGVGSGNRSRKMEESDRVSVDGESVKLKVYESKKVKKRLREELSKEESEEEGSCRRNVRRSVRRSGHGNGNVDEERKSVISSEVEKERRIDRKKDGVKRVRKGVGIGKRRVKEGRRESTLIEEDPYEFREDVEISKRKKNSGSLKNKKGKRVGTEIDRKRNRKDGVGRKRSRGDSLKDREDIEMERKKLKVETCKGGEGNVEEEEEEEAAAPGSKNVGSTTRQREVETECSRSSAVEKSTLSNSHMNSSSVVERKTGVDWFDKKVFRLERVNDFRLVGVSGEKHNDCTDKASKLQGKAGVLKVSPNSKLKVGGIARTRNQRETEDSRKHSGSSSISNQKAPVATSISGGKNLLEKSRSSVTMTKTQKTGRKKAPDMEKEDSEICSRIDSKKIGADSISITEVKSEVDSSLVLDGALTNSQKKTGGKNTPGTEKQVVRAQIKSTLVNAGWKIDYRPRMSKNYNDSVYISPTGRTYWSIVNAYNAFQGQLNSNGKDNDRLSARNLSEVSETSSRSDRKRKGRSPLFSPMPAKALGMLMRKSTIKVMAELGKKLGGDKVSKNAKEAGKMKFVNSKNVKENAGSCTKKEKLNPYVAHKGNLLKERTKENSSVGLKTKGLAGSLKSRKIVDQIGYQIGEASPNTFEGTPKTVRAQKPSFASDAHSLRGRTKNQKGCALLVRSSNKETTVGTDGFNPYAGKRTVLSWLIDSGILPINAKVQYMNRRHTRAMLEGYVTRDGIHCGCCNEVVTVPKFEVHAGSKLRQPFQNIIVETGISLLQCQLEAWNKQEESERRGFHFIDVDGDDPNDDTCGICGDGGDLICCDSCPSTFHQFCLNIQKLPPGDWHCSNCSCKYCGLVGSGAPQGDDITVSPLLSCSQCEEKYHQLCIPEMDAAPVTSRTLYNSFCGHKCKKLLQRLNKLLGVKNDLEGGFSWTLIHRFDEDSEASSRALSQRADCNSKLAVAIAVMDECFLPIIDRRSGINVIHNALYNHGSNFSRLNYSGFYTVVLERSDEIISAASIRIHGTRLAEMPFIGTRHIYRRQGMCRRLLTAIESALFSLNVEKLIIPAISDLMHTWTIVFSFKPLEESHKQEMRSMNMVVFPGTDLLQKQLLKCDFMEGNTTDAVVSAVELESSNNDTHKVENASLVSSSIGPHLHDSDTSEVKDIVAASEPSSHVCGGSAAEVVRESLDVPHGSSSQTSSEGIPCNNSEPQDKFRESTSDKAFLHHAGDKTEAENLSIVASPVESDHQSSGEGGLGGGHDTHQIDDEVCDVESNLHAFGETSEMINDVRDAVSDSSFVVSGGSAVDKPQCDASGASLVLVSDATHCDRSEVANKSTASPLNHSVHGCVEDMVHDIHEVEVAAIKPNSCSFEEGPEGSASEIISRSFDTASGCNFKASVDNTVHHNTEITQSFCSTLDHNCPPSGDCSVQINYGLVPKSPIHISGADFVLPSDIAHHDKQDEVNKSLLSSPDEPNLYASSEGTVHGTNEVNADITAIEHNSHALGNDSVLCTSKVASVSPNAVSESNYPSSDEGRSSEVLYKSCDSSDTSFHDPDVDCHNTSEVASESGGDFPAASRPHASAEVVTAVELRSNNDDTQKVENASLVASSIGSHLHDSDTSEVEDIVAASEPGSHACGGSSAEVVLESLDVSHGSCSQTSIGPHLHDSDTSEVKDIVAASEPSSHTCAGSSAEVVLEYLDVPHGSCSQISIGPHLHDSDTSEVKDIVAARKPSSHACAGSAAEVVLEYLDVPHGSCSQISIGPHLHDSDTSEVKDTVAASEPRSHACGGSAAEVVLESLEVPHGFCSQISMGPHPHDSDTSEVKDIVAASEPSSHACGFSAAEVVQSLDVPHGSSSQTSGEGTLCNNSEPHDKSRESTSNKAFIHHAGDKTEVENQFLVASPVEPDHQSSGEGALGGRHDTNQIDVEVCHVESNPLAFGETCVHYTSEMINDVQDPVSDSSFVVSNGSTVDKPQCDVSGASLVLVSDATHCDRSEVANKSTASPLNHSVHGCVEDMVHDIHEVEVAAVKPNLCSFEEGPVGSASEIISRSFDTALGYNFQASDENTVHHNTEITQSFCNTSEHNCPPSGVCSVQINYEPVPKSPVHISGAACVLTSDVAHHDKQDEANKSLLSSADEPNLYASSEGTVHGTNEVNGDITAIEHNSHALGNDSVLCTSKVAGVSLNAVSESNYPSSDEGRSSDVLYKSCDSYDTSFHDPDVDCHNTSEVASESGGNLPHASAEGTVPDIHGIESVELDNHGSVDASVQCT